jgi:hypothetical protein
VNEEVIARAGLQSQRRKKELEENAYLLTYTDLTEN